MLLTQGNEVQTRTKRIKGGMEGGRQESDEKETEEKVRHSCSSIQSKWRLDDGDKCVHLNTEAEWKISVEALRKKTSLSHDISTNNSGFHVA